MAVQFFTYYANRCIQHGVTRVNPHGFELTVCSHLNFEADEQLIKEIIISMIKLDTKATIVNRWFASIGVGWISFIRTDIPSESVEYYYRISKEVDGYLVQVFNQFSNMSERSLFLSIALDKLSKVSAQLKEDWLYLLFPNKQVLAKRQRTVDKWNSIREQLVEFMGRNGITKVSEMQCIFDMTDKDLEKIVKKLRKYGDFPSSK